MLKNNKSLGQHWLKDRALLEEIAHLAAPDPSAETTESPATLQPSPRVALEIGPGLGTLTSALFHHFDRVIAVEFDPSLAAHLPAQFPGKDLKVINADFLTFDLSILPTPYTAVGNIPYYITAPIIKKLLTTPHQPTSIVLLVQKEVAQRLAARPGRHSILSLSTEAYASVSLGPLVPRILFTPPPKVDSQVIKLLPHPTPIVSEKILQFIKLGFSSPRKKLKNNLGLPEGLLTSIGLSESARPADLSLSDWANLYARK